MSRLVSVVITTFNKAQYIAQAIESVINQTYPDIECIIVDDGSTDQTVDVVNELRRRYPEIQYFYQVNQGVSAARNFGASQTQGEWIQFLDADDWLHPEKIEHQLSILKDLDSTAVIYSDYERVYVNGANCIVDRKKQVVGDRTPESLVERLLTCPDFLADSPFPLLQQAMLFKRQIIEDRQFDRRLKACEDREFVLELLLAGIHFLYVPITAAYYRKHASNMTDDSRLMRQSYIQYFEIMVDRHPKLKPLVQQSITFLLESIFEEKDWATLERIRYGLIDYPVRLGRFTLENDWMLMALFKLRLRLPDFLLYERYRGPRSQRIFSWLARLRQSFVLPVSAT
jgi:glycosyltransferase involved in cell wall biosynthesis